MTDWLLDVFVPGVPAPQGSKNGYAIARGKGDAKVYTGRVKMFESSKKVKPWRRLVDAACRDAWAGRPPLDGPLVLDVEFVLKRLAATPKSKPSGPHTVYPDLSKLVRSTEDAISTAGVWADDARVVRTVSSKRRAEVGETLGARIRVALWTPGKPNSAENPAEASDHLRGCPAARDTLSGSDAYSGRPSRAGSGVHGAASSSQIAPDALPGLEVVSR